ncbi:MAG TPA: hypothetical protein VFO52_05040, partial [Longimicrobiales bacterium]|nr:hypothetical protein [Longimicrobiales bacterium]
MTAAHLWLELRRRRVFKTALWYAGSSVAVVEAAGLFSSIFGVSTGIVRFLAIAAVFGLPTAFMLSWCFDVATHTRQSVLSWQKVVGLSLVAGVSLLGAVVVWDRFVHDAAGATRTAPLAVDPAHIAVLSFDALGGDPRLVAFAENLHARLIDGLSRASTTRGSQRLRVVSRPGIMPYADGDASLYELRRMFKVGTVLDGTVEQVADAVRVHVRMVDTETGDQIATSIVEERADDQLVLLDAAADSVLHMIRAELGPIVRERMQLLETRSPRAFERYSLASQRVDQFVPALHQQDVDGALIILTEADSLFAL